MDPASEGLDPHGGFRLEEEENKKERIKEKGNIHSVNYGITISSKDDSGARLVKVPLGPHLRDAHGPSRVAVEPSLPALAAASTSLRTTKSGP